MGLRLKTDFLGKEQICYINISSFTTNSPNQIALGKFQTKITRDKSLSNGVNESFPHEFKKETIDKVKELLYIDLMEDEKLKGCEIWQ